MKGLSLHVRRRGGEAGGVLYSLTSESRDLHSNQAVGISGLTLDNKHATVKILLSGRMMSV